jgi:aminopeptidase N
MLHSIRNTLDDDSLWFAMLKATYQKFKYSNVTSNDIIAFMDEMTPYNLKPIFSQFLTNAEMPVLKVKRRMGKDGLKLIYQWENVVEDFNMPVIVRIDKEKELYLYPAIKRQKILLPVYRTDQVHFDTDRFYYRVDEQ